jgi:chemotaxis protein MotB
MAKSKAGKADKSRKAARPIVIRRMVKRVASTQRTGAWKIAYADFVTAMMAFFLLMWLVGTTTSDRLRGVAQYFKTPLMAVFNGGKEDSDVDSIINGGSNTPLPGTHQAQRGKTAAPVQKVMHDTKVNFRLQEIARLQQLKQRLENVIATNPALRKFKDQLLLDITSDGLRIQIIDQQNRPMFSRGSAALQPYTADILHEIGKALNEVPNKISLSGHTDAIPYQGGENYSNWDLSVDRANASRRELIAGGMDPAKVIRVVGLASSALFDQKDPYDPSNRRISILVMNKDAESSALQEDDSGLNVKDDAAGQPSSGSGK